MKNPLLIILMTFLSYMPPVSSFSTPYPLVDTEFSTAAKKSSSTTLPEDEVKPLSRGARFGIGCFIMFAGTTLTYISLMADGGSLAFLGSVAIAGIGLAYTGWTSLCATLGCQNLSTWLFGEA